MNPSIFLTTLHRDLPAWVMRTTSKRTRARWATGGVIAALALLLSTHSAAAQTASSLDLSTALQNVVTALSGTTMKLIAVLAVMLVGFAWMFGFMDLRKVGWTVLGIAIVFGAAQVVTMVTGS